MSKKFYCATDSGIKGIGAVFQKTILLITAIFLFSCSSEQDVSDVSDDHIYTVSPPAGTYAENEVAGVDLVFTYDIKYDGETVPFTVENESLPAELTLSQNGGTVTISSDPSILGDYTVSYDIVVNDNSFPYVRYTYVYNITYIPAYETYQIYTEEQLRNVKNDLGGHYILMNDIELKNGDWEPIGDNNDPFTGEFEGGGYEISGVNVSSGYNDQGFFGYISGAVVNNLGVSGNIIGNNYVGGIVGYNYVGTITNSYSSVNVTASENYAGGIAGHNYDGTITDSYSTGNVIASDSVGGITGANGGKITNCYSTGSVTGGSYAGGIAGGNSGTITNSHSTGSVTASKDYAGGIAGANSGPITNCYSTGSVEAKNNGAGGIAGVNENTIKNCYSTGSVTAHGEKTGGIAGDNGGEITNCYSTGSVNANTDHAGGIAGENEGGTITNNAALMEKISANSGYGRIIGVYDGSMIVSDNYAFSGMTHVGGGWLGDTYLDGTDVDKGIETGQISNPVFWSDTLGFSDEIWDLSFNTRTNGYLLPLLIGITPEEPDMPEHLKPNP